MKILSPTTFEIVHSPVRKHNHLSGILVLANNKTYGKYKDKFIYKCIPETYTTLNSMYKVYQKNREAYLKVSPSISEVSPPKIMKKAKRN